MPTPRPFSRLTSPPPHLTYGGESNQQVRASNRNRLTCHIGMRTCRIWMCIQQEPPHLRVGVVRLLQQEDAPLGRCNLRWEVGDALVDHARHVTSERVGAIRRQTGGGGGFEIGNLRKVGEDLTAGMQW